MENAGTLGSSSNGNPAAGIFRLNFNLVNNDPIARFTSTFLPSQSSASQHVYEFDASNSSDPDGDDLTYSWEVTDVESTDSGQPQTVYNSQWSGETSQQTFSNPRDDTTVTYTIELTVTDSAGNTGTRTSSVSITCDSSNGGQCMTKSPN